VRSRKKEKTVSFGRTPEGNGESLRKKKGYVNRKNLEESRKGGGEGSVQRRKLGSKKYKGYKCEEKR